MSTRARAQSEIGSYKSNYGTEVKFQSGLRRVAEAFVVIVAAADTIFGQSTVRRCFD